MADRYDDRYPGEEWRGGRSYGYGRDDRGFIDRAGDEVRSWFGDDEAARRRHADEARYGRERDWGRGPDWGHRMGLDYERRPWRDWSERGHTYGYGPERGWYGERWGTGREWERPRDWDRPRPVEEFHHEGRSGYPRPEPATGRGPRGYQRSDERIREDVCDRLTDDPWIDASDVEVSVRGGEVTLAGRVRDRNERRRTEDIIENVSGVREVHNNLRVGTSVEPPNRVATQAGRG